MIYKNLSGTVLRITTRYNNLYTYDVDIQKPSDLGNNYTFKGGYAADIFKNLQDLLGFSYVFVPEVGPYNFSMASAKRVDIFVGSYSLYYARAQLADPTFVTGNSKIIAVINHEHEGNIEDIFVLPFSLNLWLGIFFLFLTCFLGIFIMSWIQQSCYNWKDSLFHTAAIILQKQCVLLTIEPIGFRTLFYGLSISTIAIMATYTGTMFSIKATTRFAINSMNSLLASNFKILIELGEGPTSSVRVMLEGLLHIPAVVQLLNRYKASNYIYSTFENAIKEVLERPTAYIIDEETAMTTIYNELDQFPCMWGTLSVFDLKYPWSMFMRKNSPLKDSINYGLLRIDETGVRLRLRRRWIPYAVECKVTSVPFTSIKITQVYIAIVIYVLGLFLSFFWYILYEKRYVLNVLFNRDKVFQLDDVWNEK